MKTTKNYMKEIMESRPTYKSYLLVWNDGGSTTVSGSSIEEAFSEAGYGETDLSNLNHFEEIKHKFTN